MYAVQVVEMKDWIKELEKVTTIRQEDLENQPALKLLGFYRSLVEGQGALSVPLAMENTKAASPSMRSMPPITPDMMGNWLRQWAF